MRDGYTYVDKTEWVQKLAEDPKYLVLSRPRGFGKSLLVDTLKEAWERNRELFDGLALADSGFATAYLGERNLPELLVPVCDAGFPARFLGSACCRACEPGGGST
jgi:hypothetical protein